MFVKTLLTSLILPALLLVFGYYYTKEKPDVRYVLSESIPVKLAEESPPETLQQLEIKNVGSSEARQIQLIIRARIISYDLLKYSKADTVNEYRSGASTEIVYPALPPQGSFRLLIRSSGDGISKESLNISHSRGKAKEAFAESINNYASLLVIGIFLLYISVLSLMIRAIAVDSLESKASHDSLSVMRRRKPFYLNGARWNSIRNKALEHRVRSFGSRDIETSPSYVFLNGDKPNKLNDEDWRSSVKKASDTLSGALSETSMGSYTAGEMLNLLKVRKPVHFHEEDWTKLTKKLSGILLLMLKKDYKLRTKDGLFSAMKEKRPDQVPEDTWSGYQQFLEQEYFNFLSNEMGMIALREGSLIDYLGDQHLGCLQQEKADYLKKQAYRLQLSQLPDVLRIKGAEEFVRLGRPGWIEENDYEFRLENAKRSINLDLLTQKYQSLLSAFESILDSETC